MAPYSPPSPRRSARPVVSATLLARRGPTLSACGSEDEAERGAAMTTTQVTDAAGTLGRSHEAEGCIADYATTAAALKGDLGSQAGSSVSVAHYPAEGTAVMQQGVFIGDVLKNQGFAGLGGAQHAVSVLDDIRKAMVK